MEDLTQDSEPVFASPWEAHAFALTIKLHEEGLFSWSEWSRYLAEAVSATQTSSNAGDSEAYYSAWLAALEKLLIDKNLVGTEELLTKQKILAIDSN